MAIGQSGGRSAGNRQSGVRRATQRERDGIDPPGRDAWEKVKTDDERTWWDDLTPRGRKVMDVVAVSCWLVMCVMLAIVLCAWWGLL